jgi:hypothetical protein
MKYKHAYAEVTRLLTHGASIAKIEQKTAGHKRAALSYEQL